MSTTDYRGRERRLHPRRACVLPARIVVNGKLLSSCLIVDTSEGGVCLQFDGPIDVPESFLLEAERGPARGCRVRWRNGNRIGVEFL